MIINDTIKEVLFLTYEAGTIEGRITNLNNVHGIIPRTGEFVTINKTKYKVVDITHDYDLDVIKIWIK